jgi:hypothetical protein
MAIIPFKRATDSTKPTAKTPKRRKALLTIEPIQKKRQKAGADFESGLFNGKLVIDDHEFCVDNGNLLGIIAYICNISSVLATTPNSSQPIEIKARASYQREITLLSNDDERVFLKRFQVGLYMCTHSKAQKREFVDWWQKELFPVALAQVPEHLRVHIRMERGVYDDSGMPLSAAEISQRARHLKMVKSLENPESTGNGIINLPWEQISRMTDPHGPVAINGAAYVAVQKMLTRFGFPRMPQSFAELVQAHELCTKTSMDLHMIATLELGKEVRDATLEVYRTYHSNTYPLYEACINQDDKRIAELHAKKDWLAVLAKEFEEPEEKEGEGI